MSDDTPLLVFKPSQSGVVLDLDRLITGRALVQATSGGGKSYFLRYLLENTHGRVQQFVFDREGEFVSLREKFDYVHAGQPASRGGAADVLAHPDSAKLLCRRLLELNASAILDLSDLKGTVQIGRDKIPARDLFVARFLEELLDTPRKLWRPLMVVIDEAHFLVPEKGSGESIAKQPVIDLATIGRKRGFSTVLATQRLAKVDNNALAELQTNFIGLTTYEPDVVRAAAQLGFSKAEREAFKTLEPGHFYARGPAVSRAPVLLRSGTLVTTHPEPGKIAAPVPPAPSKIRALLSQLQDIPERAAAEEASRADLEARIRELERQLRDRLQAEPVVREVPVEVEVVREVIPESFRSRLLLAVDTSRGIAEQLADLATDLRGVLNTATMAPTEWAPKPITVQPRGSAAHDPPARAAEPDDDDDDAAPTVPEGNIRQRILDAIRRVEHLYPGGNPPRAVIAWFVGHRNPKNKGFVNPLGSLHTGGDIEYTGGGLVLTDQGRAKTTARPVATMREYHAVLREVLPGIRWRILCEVNNHGTVSRAALAAAVGHANPKNKGFVNPLGTLHSLGLVEYANGQVVATDLLVPPGLPA